MMVEFGLQLPLHSTPLPTLLRTAVAAEEFGFSSVWVYDHLFWDNKPLFEGFTLLAALAEETRKVKLGTLVLATPNRAPSLLAKMAATLDIISGGRIILGLGAGGMPREHTAYGLPFPNLIQRVEQLREAVQQIKALWTQTSTTMHGEYYAIRGAYCEPKPSQKPHPPIMIGGHHRKVITLAAEYADIWNAWNPTIQDFQKGVTRLHTAHTLFRRERGECLPSVALMAIVGEDRGEVRSKMKRHFPRTAAHDPAYFPRIVGTPSAALQSLEKYAEAEASTIILDLPDSTSRRTLQLLSRHILASF